RRGGGRRCAAMPAPRTGPLVWWMQALAGVDGPDAPSDTELLRRFVGDRDELAFAALVRRHGPMVLGVCRRVLHDEHAAEDAFQATFLLLVRKAAAIEQPELLANWLYGVAYRIALKAKAQAARRSAHERQTALMPKAEPFSDTALLELRDLLDEEMSGLPEKYRAPLVLCYLQGLTNEEAARQLGWPSGSMSSRLARARELLRERLVGRGLSLSVGGVACLLGEGAAAAVPSALVRSTVQAALLAAAGQSAAAAPAGAAALAEGVVQTMMMNRLRLAAAALVVVALLGLGAGALVRQRGLAQTPPAAGKGDPGPAKAAAPDAPGNPLPDGALARLG